MRSISARWRGAVRAGLLASTLAVAAMPELVGDGFVPTDDPDSAYFHSSVMPPSWQGRPYAIPHS